MQVEAAPSRRRKPRTLLKFPEEFLPTQSGQKSRNSLSNSRSYFGERLPTLTRSGKSNTNRRDSFEKFPAKRKSHRKKRFLPEKSSHDSRYDNEKRPPTNNEINEDGQARDYAEQSLDLYRTGPPSTGIPTPQTETPTALMSTAKLRSLNLSSLRRLEQVCTAAHRGPSALRVGVTVLIIRDRKLF